MYTSIWMLLNQYHKALIHSRPSSERTQRCRQNTTIVSATTRGIPLLLSLPFSLSLPLSFSLPFSLYLYVYVCLFMFVSVTAITKMTTTMQRSRGQHDVPAIKFPSDLTYINLNHK